MKKLLVFALTTILLAGCATTGSMNSKNLTKEKAEAIRQQTVENIARMQRNMRNKGEYYPTGSPDDFYLYFLGQDGKTYRVKRNDWEVVPTEDSYPTVLEKLNKEQRSKLAEEQKAEAPERPRKTKFNDPRGGR